MLHVDMFADKDVALSTRIGRPETARRFAIDVLPLLLLRCCCCCCRRVTPVLTGWQLKAAQLVGC
jgi:hypothetical protein